MAALIAFLRKYVLYIALVQALVATLGSLYFSEIAGIVPCVLCWYQRICMYPLVVILAVGILKKDKLVAHYVLPLSIIGFLIATYHFLLQMGVVPESVAPCVAGVSCASRFVQWFGFVTIPFLSMVAFAVITGCMVFFLKQKKYVK
ncbi:MAG: disulfide bond formation protein B [Candidatus Levybacteria bacterium]|nr:disulfide bond formation protein B [Candidatus Levybacteria bacterium]